MKIKVLQNQWQSSPQQTLAEVAEQIEAGSKSETDFWVLPEHVLVPPSAEPLPEQLRQQALMIFSQMAKQHECYIATGSWLEIENNQLVNVMRLLDRQGKYVAKLVRPYVNGKRVVGSDFPVIDTDKGKIGLLLGQDFWAMETSRIQSLQGASLILVSGSMGVNNLTSKKAAIWGIATLNCVAVAFASTTDSLHGGGSTIALPDQVIDNAEQQPTVVCAQWDDDKLAYLREADLSFKNTLWYGLWARRKALYTPLTVENKL